MSNPTHLEYIGKNIKDLRKFTSKFIIQMKKETTVQPSSISPAIAKQVLAAAVEPFLPLELGQMYKTRSGNKVTIRDIDYSYTMPFFGDIVTKENKHVRVASFNADGMYKNGEQTQFDIVGLWNERP